MITAISYSHLQAMLEHGGWQKWAAISGPDRRYLRKTW